MDEKNKKLDFKLLVEHSLNLLESLSAASRCDALHYLLQTLKCKYPEACDQVVKNLFPHIVGDCLNTVKSETKRKLQILQGNIKEEIKTEDEGSTDLNQNFEKILCKEEFMCLEEDDEDGDADDVDNENSLSLSKRLRFSVNASNRDPLDLIPSSVIDTRRLLKTKYHGSYSTENYAKNSVDFSSVEADESNGYDLHSTERPLKRITNHRAKMKHRYKQRILSEKLVLSCNVNKSKLGEGYVFNPDSELTIFYHHSTGELNVLAFKEQFRFRLQDAWNKRCKPFLKNFYKNFVLTGHLLGTTPPAHVLKAIRVQREHEWQMQHQRKGVTLQNKRRALPANIFDSEIDSETESQLSSTAQEIMKFEEIMDEDVGVSRLIDGMEMEPEMEDVLGSGSSGSNSSIGGRTVEVLPRLIKPESVSTMVMSSGVADTGTSANIGSVNNNLQLNQEQQSTNNLVINGLTTTSNNTINICTPQTTNIENLPNLNTKEQTQLNQQTQHQYHNVLNQQIEMQLPNQINSQHEKSQPHEQHFLAQLQQKPVPEQQSKTPIFSAQQTQIQTQQHLQHPQKLSLENSVKKEPLNITSVVITNSMPIEPAVKQQMVNNSIGNVGQSLYLTQQQQQHQRLMLQQQQESHFNTSLHQSHPLAMMGNMMGHQLQPQPQQNQLQQHNSVNIQQNQTTSLGNTIDNLLERPLSGQQPQQQHIQQEQLSRPQNISNPLMQHQNLHQQPVLLQTTQQTPNFQHKVVTPSPTSSILSATVTSSLSTGSIGNLGAIQQSVSLDLEDNELSHDDEDDENDNDNELDDLETKQQLIDGGSSSSTSLQALPGLGSAGNQSASGSGIKKAKPSYDCLLCPKSYRKRKSLLDHYKIHPGYCHDCGQQNGTTLEEIIHHNRTVHVKEYPFVCETCGESYSRRQQFHAHVESHNKKEFKTAYSCVECGIKFPHKKLHQQHLEDTGHKHDGAICEVCGAEFPSKNALYQHIIRVHKKDNLFECHICQNRFTLKANLERHVQLHTEIKRTYVCDLCGSSYFTYPALKDHYSNAHTDASECKCALCGKRFGSAKSLQRHLPSHSEERPHCCCYCDQTFKWKTHLVRHKQTVHGNQPSSKKVKRFSKVDEELIPMPDMPGPPPAKVAKKSNSSKPKQPQQTSQQQSQQQNQQQQLQQQKAATVPTPPPLASTPGTSQESQFNAAIISNNSSQSSTASTSQHSLSTSESQQNSMYSHSFSAEKLIGQQQTQQQQQQQQQQRPTPSPTQQQQPNQQQPPVPTQQQSQTQHHRHTQSNNTTEGSLMSRLNNFGGIASENQFHFEQNATNATNPGSYQQHQIINQYQQHHHQQQQSQAAASAQQQSQQQQSQQQQQQQQSQQQQQHLRSHTPQSPHQQQMQQHQQHQQHFTSPHHIPTPQQQMQHHHQQLLHQHQLQHQQQQHRHNQQRSPHHHQTTAQQLQQQHQQSHSPQHTRLQSPQPVQVHAPHTPHAPLNPHTPQPPPTQNASQQQQYQQQCGTLQQQTADAWGNIGFGPPGQSGQTNNPQQNANATNVSGVADGKDNSNKFYIVDSTEFLGLPINVAGGGTAVSNASTAVAPPSQQQQPSVVGSVGNKQQQQEPTLGSDLLGFQTMWSQTAQPTQLGFGSATQQQTQQQQQQQQQQQVSGNTNQTPGGNATAGGGNDAHNYNNIGSILTNLIDNNPNPMDYNFELMQPASVTQTQQQQQSSLATHHHQQQQQQQQQHHPNPVSYGLQPTPGAAGLMRHTGVYGTSIYDGHHAAHHAALNDITEQQKNSFQPYHPHTLQAHANSTGPHPHALAGHPLSVHHPLAAATHLLPPSHASVYDRAGYPVLGDETKTVLPPISDYMHHMQQQQQLTHPQNPDMVYYPVKND